jgi:ATP-dependent RNA helicase DeaD
LSIIQKEELEEMPEFENELGITFKEFIKADVQSIEENNGLLWARKVFKTKPNREVSEEFKTKIKTIFHHLTKDELVEKILANYLASTSSANTKTDSTKKHKKK